METLTTGALEFYPPAPSNGGLLTAQTPPKIGDWAWQPKVDDWRGIVYRPTLQVWNQYGEVSCVERQRKIDAALEELQEACSHWDWFDIGIMENRHDGMRGSIIVFDVMGTPWNHRERRVRLEEMFTVLPLASELLAGGQVRNGLYVINEWRADPVTNWNPLTMQTYLQRENERVGFKFYEGLVAKRRDALYPVALAPKQKTNLWVKHRFDQ